MLDSVHSPDDMLEFIKPVVQRYRSWCKLFWLRGDAAFANPETYEYYEAQHITYFIRLPSNANLLRLLELHLNRPVGRPPQSGIQVKIVDLHDQAKSRGGGRCISPRPFPWLTITVRCWPGLLRLTSQTASGHRGIGMPEIYEKLIFRPNLCYFATCKKNWPRKDDRLGDFTQAKRLQ